MRFWILASAIHKTGLGAFWRRLHSRALSRLGLGLVLAVVLAGALAPILAPYDPTHQKFSTILQGPTRQHPLGTDDLGRDVLSRLMWGARVSLKVGVIAVSIALVTGTILGLLSGYIGGILDNWLMRLMDALLAFPVLVLVLALAAILSPSLSNTGLASACSRVSSMACSSLACCGALTTNSSSSSHRSVVPQGHWMAFSTPYLLSHASLLSHTRL